MGWLKGLLIRSDSLQVGYKCQMLGAFLGILSYDWTNETKNPGWMFREDKNFMGANHGHKINLLGCLALLHGVQIHQYHTEKYIIAPQQNLLFCQSISSLLESLF